VVNHRMLTSAKIDGRDYIAGKRRDETGVNAGIAAMTTSVPLPGAAMTRSNLSAAGALPIRSAARSHGCDVHEPQQLSR
jgi:hypothetical protein